MKRFISALAASAMFVGFTQAQAHGPQEHASNAGKKISTEETAFGRKGSPEKVTRTIRVDMADTMRYSPDTVTVKKGETIRFVIKNSGQQMHELVIGTEKELTEHAELMRKFPTMEHDEPYMAHVQPGKEEAILWQFTKPGEFHFGCLIPGHFEAGMKGRIVVVSK